MVWCIRDLMTQQKFSNDFDASHQTNVQDYIGHFGWATWTYFLIDDFIDDFNNWKIMEKIGDWRNCALINMFIYEQHGHFPQNANVFRFKIFQYCESSYLTFDACDSKNHNKVEKTLLVVFCWQIFPSAVSSGSKPHKGAGVVPGDRGPCRSVSEGMCKFF